jgi:propionate catabolism operon transcriptional regulator
VKPYRENDVTSGALIRLRNTNQIIQEEGKIRQQLAKEGLMAKYHFKDILGSSKAIRENIEMAERYSKVNSNILILGETGTGKELFADSIHNASLRADKPFVAINCAALPENLLESELFGYEPGAFSGASRQGKIGLFELADKGTLFLDEIGEMPIALQAKLLRVLQEKEVRRIGSTNVHSVDVRVISATNIDIEREVEEGKFRPDLYYRLDLLDIRIPPLRERKEDIEELFSSFVAKIASEMGRKVPHLTDDAAEMLKNYRWKGNVRELRNICERLVVLNDSDSVNADTMRLLNIFRDQPKPQKEAVQTRTYTTSKKVNQTEIARELGISRTTLWRRNRKKEGGTTQ